MKNFKHFLRAGLVAVSMIAASAAFAAPITFVAPNGAGRVYTTNGNDGWAGGRGIGFGVTSSQVISSVGVYQNLNNMLLSYGLYEISSPTGNFSKTSTLRSGSATVTTVGLQFIDFGFADLTLATNKNYLLEFRFAGNSAQNFFHNNNNQVWTQGAYKNLEGTSGNGFANSVVGSFRVNGLVNDVPEPGNIFLIGAALLGLAAARRARKA
jgi:hypothetical protein